MPTVKPSFSAWAQKKRGPTEKEAKADESLQVSFSVVLGFGERILCCVREREDWSAQRSIGSLTPTDVRKEAESQPEVKQ